MDMGFSCRKSAFFQASIKLAQPFPAPELRTRILRTRGFCWASKQAKTFARKCEVIKALAVSVAHKVNGSHGSTRTSASSHASAPLTSTVASEAGWKRDPVLFVLAKTKQPC